MQFERIGRISMRHFFFEIRRQVDDRNSFEGASYEIESARSEIAQDIKTLFHFLTQIPQPIHRNSEMNAILSVGFTSIHSLPTIAPGQSRALNKHLIPDTRPF
jgi:hypothetical protein